MLHPRRAAVVARQATLRPTAPGVPPARRPLQRRTRSRGDRGLRGDVFQRLGLWTPS